MKRQTPKKQTRQTAELRLPIFKQGSDLACHLEESNDDVGKALLGYADRLIYAAELVKQVARATQGIQLEIEADGHVISVTGPADCIGQLVDLGLLQESEWEEEVEE